MCIPKMKQMVPEHDPDFLYTWRHVSLERHARVPEVCAVNLSRATRQEAASEAEALRLWLADGGDLADASLYGLEIVVDDDSINQSYA